MNTGNNSVDIQETMKHVIQETIAWIQETIEAVLQETIASI